MVEENQEDQTHIVIGKQEDVQSPAVAVENAEKPVSQPEPQTQPEVQQDTEPHSIFYDLLDEELQERKNYGASRPSVLEEIINRRRNYVRGLSGTAAYSVEEHMAVARRNYGVPPEIVYGAAKWTDCDSFTEETMRQLVKAYSERKA